MDRRGDFMFYVDWPTFWNWDWDEMGCEFAKSFGHGSKPNRNLSEHPNPTTKIGSKMGGAPIPKWDLLGFDPQPFASLWDWDAAKPPFATLFFLRTGSPSQSFCRLRFTWSGGCACTRACPKMCRHPLGMLQVIAFLREGEEVGNWKLMRILLIFMHGKVSISAIVGLEPSFHILVCPTTPNAM